MRITDKETIRGERDGNELFYTNETKKVDSEKSI